MPTNVGFIEKIIGDYSTNVRVGYGLLVDLFLLCRFG